MDISHNLFRNRIIRSKINSLSLNKKSIIIEPSNKIDKNNKVNLNYLSPYRLKFYLILIK